MDGLTPCQSCGEPTDPRNLIDVEDRGPTGGRFPGVFRRAVCCPACIDRSECDQWMARGEWDGLTPAVPFDALPSLPEDKQ